MKTAMLKKMVKIAKAAMMVETAMWEGAFKSPETREMAEKALANLIAKFDRVCHVLFIRYGLDYRYSRATELLAIEV